MKCKPECKDVTASVILTLFSRVGSTHPLLGCEAAVQALKQDQAQDNHCWHGPSTYMGPLQFSHARLCDQEYEFMVRHYVNLTSSCPERCVNWVEI